MRILYFTRDYTTHDRRFLNALASSEHRVAYLRLERRGHQLEDRPLPPEIEIVPWNGGRAPFRWQDLPRLLLDLKRVIRQVKPDLIHAGPIQTSGLLAALSGFRPLVSMSWGSDLLHDAGRNAWYRWATCYTLAHSDVMIGDCEPVRQKAIEFGMPDENIVTFPWGVNLERFSPHGEQPDPQAFTLLSTRGWEPIYGVDLIARAFVLAGSKHPDLRLIMLANGSQAGMLRRIFSQAGFLDENATTSRVILPGQVSESEVPRYFRKSDLYVSASHSDGTSISLLQALASGRPVLVSDIPGNREWVQDDPAPGERVGWRFPDGDVQALAGAIEQAIESRPLLPKMGRAARRLAENRADWNKNFQQLLEAYRTAGERYSVSGIQSGKRF